ncbi:MAG: tetratricopeptide repeat-containing glycosyltransferase family protein [Alphaproteobacteria bacterium]|nr:tetratricopeptide repeat-containing glycosyltransferase family protein [Alphaproteobacteria bacterium]
MRLTSQQSLEAKGAYERGVAAQSAGNLSEAMREWRCALALNPQHENARYNLAVALSLIKDIKNAEEHYEKLIVLNQTHREGLFNLANLLYRQERVGEAAALYERLIKAHPDYVAGWINLAKSRSDRGDFEAAEPMLRKALHIEPQHVVAHWNLSHVLLAQGKWAEAWGEYEWRLRLPHWLKPPVAAPAWHKGSKAQRILLWNDQGIGDAIQFLRYPRFLSAMGREVWVLVQDNLKTLAATAEGVAGVLGPSDPLPEFDAQAPILSLPHLLSMPEPVGGTAYLKKAPLPPLGGRGVGVREAVGVYNFHAPPHPNPLPPSGGRGNPVSLEITKSQGRKAVGLVWAGNQNFEKDSRRSAPLGDLLPLFDTTGIDWFSLQFGSAAAQIRQNNLSDRVIDLSPRLHDFADTAAALSALDLVICIDSSVAHLAGALNIPCWLMLPTATDWRWQGQSATTPWYPSLRIFRQQTAGDWRGLASMIANELLSF